MSDTSNLLPDLRLRFNIDHPNLEECYIYGYECGANDIPEEENPYAQGSLEHEHWLEGWWSGVYGEEPLYSLEETGLTATPAIEAAANDSFYHHAQEFFSNFFNITSTLAATALIGYQIIELVA